MFDPEVLSTAYMTVAHQFTIGIKLKVVLCGERESLIEKLSCETGRNNMITQVFTLCIVLILCQTLIADNARS